MLYTATVGISISLACLGPTFHLLHVAAIAQMSTELTIVVYTAINLTRYDYNLTYIISLNKLIQIYFKTWTSNWDFIIEYYINT